MHDNADSVNLQAGCGSDSLSTDRDANTGSQPRVINRRHEGVPAGAVYVGRPTKWGNPFKVGVHGKQGECVELYREWLPTQTHLILEALNELRGMDLVCWCAPKPCHADVLLEFANADL